MRHLVKSLYEQLGGLEFHVQKKVCEFRHQSLFLITTNFELIAYEKTMTTFILPLQYLNIEGQIYVLVMHRERQNYRFINVCQK